MTSRLRLVLAACAVALSPVNLAAQSIATEVERSAATLITPTTDAAIGRGLEWLASRQDEDGSFGASGRVVESKRGKSALIGS